MFNEIYAFNRIEHGKIAEQRGGAQMIQRGLFISHHTLHRTASTLLV